MNKSVPILLLLALFTKKTWVQLTTSNENIVDIKPGNLPQCPDNFAEEEDFCYVLIKSKFPPKCPFANNIPFDAYATIVSTSEAIWMPARRNTSYGHGLMEWREASASYKTYIDNYTITGTNKEQSCLLYYTNGTISTVSCNEEHFGVCAYNKLNLLSNQLCEHPDLVCRPSDFDPSSKCFCLSTTTEEYQKAEFLKPYQNNIYGALAGEEVCSIGLERTAAGTYVWSGSKTEIQYSYWSDETNFGEGYIYGASTSRGWILTEVPPNCSLYEKNAEEINPSLHLTFDNSTYIFSLVVKNSRGLKWLDENVQAYCFTDAFGLLFLYRYSISEMEIDNKAQVYNFRPVRNNSAVYWCEAFKFSTSESIKSNVVDTRPFYGEEFVLFLDAEYPAGTNLLRNEALSSVYSVMDSFEDASGVMANYNYRIMTIVDLDDNHTIINIHLSSKNNATDGTDEQYYALKESVYNMYHETSDIKIIGVDLRNADYCVWEQKRNVTWKRTPLGQAASPVEFCFKTDGTIPIRLCSGDHLNGAYWSATSSNCKIAQESPKTKELLLLLDSINSKSSKKVWQISQNDADLKPLDIYLIMQFYTKGLLTLKLITDKYFSETVNSLLDIDQELLAESQNLMKATDGFLALFRTFINMVYNSRIIQSNFVYQLAMAKNATGFIVRQNGSVVTLNGSYTVEDVMEIENLQTAVWLSPQLLQQLTKTDLVVFMVFFKDSFFNDATVSKPTLGNIVATVLPSVIVTKPIWFLNRIDSQYNKSKTCSFWNFDEHNRGSWKTVGPSKDRSPFQFCEFRTQGYFALTTLPDDGVTDDLEQMLVLDLVADSTYSDTLGLLKEISTRYEEFVSVDIHLTGQILQKMTNNEEVSLPCLASVVSNLHQVKRDVLLESQKDEGATDLILQNVDAIARSQNYESHVEASADTFMIVISDFNNFTGLVLLKANDTAFRTKLLTDNTSLGDAARDENFESALLFSEDLKRQMGEDAKIVVTVFGNDALFNDENTTTATTGKIFGVLLPDIGNYSGPISVYHKVDGESQKDCVHWYYDEASNVKGSWQKDGDGVHVQGLVECQFWHTTHFGLLVIEKNLIDTNTVWLDRITKISCAISLVSLGGVILTAVLFEKWRSNSGNQILLNFVFADILQIGAFYSSDLVHQKYATYPLCTIIGVLLHYTMIAQFCWSLITAILHFRRFVKVLGGPPKRVVLKACLIGWILPLGPAIGLLVADKDNYIKNHSGLCYPSGLGLYLGVWLPVMIIILFNLGIFIYIMYSVISSKRSECVGVGCKELFFQWRLALLLFFMLGLTWGFAFLAELDCGTVFLYLFCATATLQGFIVFMFFIMFNASTRSLYVDAIKRRLSQYH